MSKKLRIKYSQIGNFLNSHLEFLEKSRKRKIGGERKFPKLCHVADGEKK